MRRFYNISIAATHRQVVLARTCSLALAMKVDIIELSSPPCWDDVQPAGLAMVVQAPQQAIERFSRRVARMVDVVEADVQERDTAVPAHPCHDVSSAAPLATHGSR